MLHQGTRLTRRPTNVLIFCEVQNVQGLIVDEGLDLEEQEDPWRCLERAGLNREGIE